jgi:PKD domain
MRRLVLLAAAVASLLALAAPAAFAAPTWLPAQALSGPPAYGLRPLVAMDPAGDSVAIWPSDGEGKESLMAASRPAGGSWSAPVPVTTAPTGLEIYDLNVVISAAGEVTVAWDVIGGATPVVQVSSERPGGSWSAPTTISTPGRQADGLDLAVDSAGHLTAAWQEYNGNDFVVVVADRRADGVWTTPLQVSPTVGNAQQASLAVDDQGDAVVAWSEQLQIGAATRSHGGAWSAPIEVTPAGEIVRPPKVAMDPAGEAVVVWSRFEGSHYLAQSRTMSPAGAWSEKVDLSDPSFDVYDAEVAIDPAGEAVAVWEHEGAGDTGVIEGASRPLGSAWSQAAGLTPPGDVASSPDLAISASGEAVLVWEGGSSVETMTPFGIARPAGGGWGAPHGLAPNAKRGNYPMVATDAGGDAVVAWESYGDPSTDIVEAAGLDGQGPRLSDVSIPTGGQVGTPLSFSVKATDVWSPIAAASWQFGDGSSAAGEAVDHAYRDPGSFPVGLRVTDAAGNGTAIEGGPVTVVAPPPAAGGAPRGLARARGAAPVKKGRAALTLSCVGGDCAGVAKLYSQPPRQHGKHRRRRPVLAGEGSFRIGSGGQEVVEVKVRPSVLRRLRRSPSLHLATTLGGTDIAPGKVLLHEAKRKGRRVHR